MRGVIKVHAHLAHGQQPLLNIVFLALVKPLNILKPSVAGGVYIFRKKKTCLDNMAS